MTRPILKDSTGREYLVEADLSYGVPGHPEPVLVSAQPTLLGTGGPVAEGKIRTASGTPVTPGALFDRAWHLVQRNAVLRAARDAQGHYAAQAVAFMERGIWASVAGDWVESVMFNRDAAKWMDAAHLSEPLASLWAFFDWAAEGA